MRKIFLVYFGNKAPDKIDMLDVIVNTPEKRIYYLRTQQARHGETIKKMARCVVYGKRSSFSSFGMGSASDSKISTIKYLFSIEPHHVEAVFVVNPDRSTKYIERYVKSFCKKNKVDIPLVLLYT